MLKITLLLSTLLLLSGCVERGYKLTVNNQTRTVTAQKTIDLRLAPSSTLDTDIKEMNKAVKKVQKSQTNQAELSKEKSINNNRLQEKEHLALETKEAQNNLDKKQKEAQLKKAQQAVDAEALRKKQNEDDRKALENKRIAEEKSKYIAYKKEKEKLTQEAKEARKALALKLAKEKEDQRVASEKETLRLAQKAVAEKKALEHKLANEKKVKKYKLEKEAFEKKIAAEKAAQLRKEKAEKLALERKIAAEKAAQLRKEKAEKLALKRKDAAQRKAKVAAEKREKETLERKIAAEKSALLRKEKAEKAALARQLLKEQKAQALKLAEEKKVPLTTTESILFEPSSQTYQKFGTSEIHGHVVYLTPNGQEIRLKNTKIFLVQKNTKMDYWYKNYYLKNKQSNSLSKTKVNYINATHLNIDGNFAFYGLPIGSYYVIIESSYPKSIAKNKKVYIAKKINVEKYKKIMTVFSKKL